MALRGGVGFPIGRVFAGAGGGGRGGGGGGRGALRRTAAADAENGCSQDVATAAADASVAPAAMAGGPPGPDASTGGTPEPGAGFFRILLQAPAAAAAASLVQKMQKLSQVLLCRSLTQKPSLVQKLAQMQRMQKRRRLRSLLLWRGLAQPFAAQTRGSIPSLPPRGRRRVRRS